MSIELAFALVTMTAVLVMVAHARTSTVDSEFERETLVVGHVAADKPPPLHHDVLDDYAAEMQFEALTAEGSAEHRLALLEALLEEADHETCKLETLVDKLGRELLTAA